jgi:hypothetical protein
MSEVSSLTVRENGWACCEQINDSISDILCAPCRAVSSTVNAIVALAADLFACIRETAQGVVRYIRHKTIQYFTRTILSTPYYGMRISSDEYPAYEQCENQVLTSLKTTRAIPLRICTKQANLTGIYLNQRGNKTRKCIVFFLPGDKVWEEEIGMLQNLSKKSGCGVICYNYRGSGGSRGVVEQEHDLIEDANAIIEESKKFGDIFVIGHGHVGGFLAAHCAAHYKLPSANCFSISSLGDFWRAKIPVIGAIISGIFAAFGWELNAKESIPSMTQQTIIVTDPAQVPTPAQFSTAYADREVEDDNTQYYTVDDQTALSQILDAYYAKVREIHNPAR